MKIKPLRHLALAVLWLALTPGNAPAQAEPPPGAAAAAPSGAPAAVPALKPPHFHCDTPLLLPASVLEIDFPAPVIPADKINTETAANLLVTEPAIPGKGIWTSRTTARFSLQGLPPLAGEIKFSLPAGHKYEDGKEIPAADFGARRTPDFQLAHSQYVSRESMREPSILLLFNDAVQAEQSAPFILFTSEAGGKAPARITPLLWKDSGQFSWLQGFGESRNRGVPWSASWPAPAAGQLPPVNPADRVPHAVVVRPVNPLPAGVWKIEVMQGMANAMNSARLAQPAVSTVRFTVAELALTSSSHSTRPDGTIVLSVGFSKPLSGGKDIDWSKYIRVEPAAADVKIDREPYALSLTSPDFVYRKAWTVTVLPGLPCDDGLSCSKDLKATITATPEDPDLSLPSWDTAQLAAGERTYRIHTKNLKDLRVRVKLMTGQEAISALRGYASMTSDENESRSGKPKPTDLTSGGVIPWSLVPGKTILDRTWQFEGKIDVSYPVTLDWSKLLPGEKTPGVLFVSAEGEDLPVIIAPGEKTKHQAAQAIVQLTDIGLAWKLNKPEAVLYAYSLLSGLPLPETKLTLHGEDGGEVSVFSTDAQGICRVPRVKGAQLLTASKGSDQFTVAFDRTLPRESLWRFPVDVDWNPADSFRRYALMFTDRGLYRPGETVHMKGIVRKRFDTDLRMPDETMAEFVVTDQDEKEVVRKNVSFTAQATFSETFTLPPEKVGHYTMRLEFPKPPQPEKPAAASSSDGDEREGEFEGEYIYNESGEDDDRVFTAGFRVEEFRKNTFEIKMEEPAPEPGSVTAEVAVAANYFMGQHLSDASVRYYVNAQRTGFYPEKYSGWLFGDHDGYDPYYWSYYYGWKERYYGEDRIQDGSDNQTGELQLGADGKVKVPVVLPKSEFPSAHEVNVSVEITDVNQQTLTESTSFRVEAASLHLGINRVDRIIRTGEPMPLEFLALTTSAAQVDRDLPVHVKIEQEVFETVRVETSSGFSQTRSEPRRTIVKEEDITIPAFKGGKPQPFAYAFSPDKAGRYYVELRARDEAGRETASRSSRWVYGAGEYAWEYEQGSRIRLVPEKQKWKPGETARVLVMTPIDGTALVTLERGGVVRAFTAKLTEASPVLEIPLKDDDAPNVYVSVLVIKGMTDNKRDVKEPVLKLGYCQLTVEDTKEELAVTVQAPKPSYRPGATAEIVGDVKNREGQPVAGAEVTLWAVDEGVLTVMGYENPDPRGTFMPLLPLGVRCGTSLSLYLPENTDQRWYVNKGFTIGGGGEGDDVSTDRLRKDFNPLAFWQADVQTDDHGHYAVKFTAPDSLTRYRVLAMAIKGARGFGVKESSLTVNKPLMLEPVVPRFASVGDVLVPKAVVHNTSPWSGTFAVTLEMDEEAKFAGDADKDRHSMMRQIELAAGETKPVTWDVRFVHYGDAVWRWRAEPVQLPSEVTPADRAELVDFTQSSFPVQYPGPLLSESHPFVLTGDKPSADLLSGFKPELLNRATRVELELSRSRFIDGAEAINYLLHYPYGCVEQTSSSTVPWFAAKLLKPLLPKLKRSDAEISKAIQGGADRLLTMQTDSGGLAYWPGGKNPELWASGLGGMTLLNARANGAVVPEDRITKLAAWISGQLRGLGAVKDTHVQEDSALALYALSLAGKFEEGYAATLYDRRDGLTNAARSYLALAFAKAGNIARAKELLAVKAPADAPHTWRHYDYETALRLLALTCTAPESGEFDDIVNKLMTGRGPQGHWNNTWCNGWTVHALAEWTVRVEKPQATAQIRLSGLASQTLDFGDASPAHFFDLKPQAGQPVALAGALTDNGRIFARVKLTGQPELLPMREVESGLSITRDYRRLTAEGKTEPLGEPVVGDLVLVTLRLRVPGDIWYVAVDDPLPCTFEAVNSAFESQSAGSAAAEAQGGAWRRWVCDHEELRDDRALFFCDRVYTGNYEVKYLARVSGVGEATAPQAKIEAMYEPQKFGLSTSERVKTRPRAPGQQTAAR